MHPSGLNLKVISIEKGSLNLPEHRRLLYTPMHLHFPLLALFLIMTVLDTFCGCLLDVCLFYYNMSSLRARGVYLPVSLTWCLARDRCPTFFVELENQCMFDKREYESYMWGTKIQKGWCLISMRRVMRDKAGLWDCSCLLSYPFFIIFNKI